MSKGHRVGKLEEFPVGKFRIVDVAGAEVGILRMQDGEVHAVLNMCPHKVAPICRGFLGGTWPPSEPGELKYRSEGEVLVCPRHGWEFEVRSGKELFQQRPARLHKYEVVLEGDDVVVMGRNARAAE